MPARAHPLASWTGHNCLGKRPPEMASKGCCPLSTPTCFTFILSNLQQSRIQSIKARTRSALTGRACVPFGKRRTPGPGSSPLACGESMDSFYNVVIVLNLPNTNLQTTSLMSTTKLPIPPVCGPEIRKSLHDSFTARRCCILPLASSVRTSCQEHYEALLAAASLQPSSTRQVSSDRLPFTLEKRGKRCLPLSGRYICPLSTRWSLSSQ